MKKQEPPVTVQITAFCTPKKLLDAARALVVLGTETYPVDQFTGVLIILLKAIRDVFHEVDMWRALWCDKPEDRLYHAADRTWWRRKYKKSDRPYSPYRADPPPEIMLIVRAARKLPRKSKALQNALSYFPD